MIRVAGTTWLASVRSNANRPRCFAPPSTTETSPVRTSSGPSTRNDAAACRSELLAIPGRCDGRPRLSSILEINRARDSDHSRSESSSACRRHNGASEGGSSLSVGIRAPCTSTGMTRVPRSSAVSTSTRTKSAGSSSRRLPSVDMASDQRGPISAKRTLHFGMVSLIASTKSSPASMPATSMNTSSSSKWRESASCTRPA